MNNMRAAAKFPQVRNSTLGLGVINIDTNTSAAEVPIPVVAEPSEDHMVNEKTPTSAAVPNISVTRPPAPRPLELPTEHDIAPYSPDVDEYRSDYQDGDLEAGQAIAAEEIQSATPTSASQSIATTPKAAARSPANVPLPGSPTTQQGPSPTPAPVPAPPVEDLLADSAPVLSATPIEPSLSPSTSPSTSKAMDSVVREASSADEASETDEASGIDVTSPGIRLVGGGGTSGAVVEEVPEPQETEAPTAIDADAVDNARAETASPVPADGAAAKAEKRKSVTHGLKKLGNLGRRKGSSSSIKSIKDKV
jgi:hypothetical protein